MQSDVWRKERNTRYALWLFRENRCQCKACFEFVVILVEGCCMMIEQTETTVLFEVTPCMTLKCWHLLNVGHRRTGI